MELYQLTAILNNTATSFIFDYLPENFEGVKISQSFSFVNPIGYTPKFSIDTMRVIVGDKSKLDAVFLAYGLESDVEIEVRKLNAAGTAYDPASTFAIDFESCVIQDDYSEFALKSISAIDDYNNTKNTEIQMSLTSSINLPTTQKYINYVSLKSNGVIKGTADEYDSLFYYLQFAKNQEAKLYDDDTALFLDLPYKDADFYDFNNSGTGTVLKDIRVSMSGEFKVTLPIQQRVVVAFCLTNTGRNAWAFYDQTLAAGAHTIQIDNTPVVVSVDVNIPSDYLFAVIYSPTVMTVNSTNLFVDTTKITEVPIVNTTTEKIKYVTPREIFNKIFNNKIIFDGPTSILNYGVTSANSILKLNDYINMKPKEFLSDFCAAFGMIANFRKSGYVKISSIADYFNDLFAVDEFGVKVNALSIPEYKDISVKYNMQLNFASVDVGHEVNEYDIFSYLIDWNKVLTFKQENRNASENLDLTLQKFRTDFSGMLDYYVKRSKQKQKTSKDNFFFNPNLVAVSGTDASIKLYDYLTPRNILTNWVKYISFCFQNFGKNTLTISSNGGNPDNLAISGVNQMDDLVINSTPRLLPIEYEFTCLINDVNFADTILEINHNEEDVYLFVIKAETTDTLSEQKINGLKIQF